MGVFVCLPSASQSALHAHLKRPDNFPLNLLEINLLRYTCFHTQLKAYTPIITSTACKSGVMQAQHPGVGCYYWFCFGNILKCASLTSGISDSGEYLYFLVFLEHLNQGSRSAFLFCTVWFIWELFLT